MTTTNKTYTSLDESDDFAKEIYHLNERQLQLTRRIEHKVDEVITEWTSLLKATVRGIYNNGLAIAKAQPQITKKLLLAQTNEYNIFLEKEKITAYTNKGIIKFTREEIYTANTKLLMPEFAKLSILYATTINKENAKKQQVVNINEQREAKIIPKWDEFSKIKIGEEVKVYPQGLINPKPGEKYSEGMTTKEVPVGTLGRIKMVYNADYTAKVIFPKSDGWFKIKELGSRYKEWNTKQVLEQTFEVKDILLETLVQVNQKMNETRKTIKTRR